MWVIVHDDFPSHSVVALIFVVSVDGVCQNITTWDAVPEDQYDM